MSFRKFILMFLLYGVKTNAVYKDAVETEVQSDFTVELRYNEPPL
jgi:hypothetical protein